MTLSKYLKEGPGYEKEDMSVRGVAAVLGGFALIVAVAVAGIGYGLHVQGRISQAARAPAVREQEATSPVPGPNLQAVPRQDLAAVQARENTLLASYAWLAPGHSAARIPIDRAMALVAGRSLDPASPAGGAR